MCGIIGILGNTSVASDIVEALKRLEYRGYDSSGVATLEHGQLTVRRAKGKIRQLEAQLKDFPLIGTIGIGHTRWATHGKPTELNAHPHIVGGVSVVHNGIIENFAELRTELEGQGAVFQSETDTEVVAHLVAMAMQRGLKPCRAVLESLPRLQGAFALVFLFEGYDNLLIAARRGSPLVIGYGDGQMYVGSDATALAPFTSRIAYLEDGDVAVVTRAVARVFNSSGKIVHRPVITSVATSLTVDKGNYRHFMAKEIHEQPEVVRHTLARCIDVAVLRVILPGELHSYFRTSKRMAISACGTAFYAAYIGKYWFERYARLLVEIDVASEFRYREVPMAPTELAIFVSQSGETADTLATLRYAKEHQQHVVSIVNVGTSTIARESDVVLPTLAGPEIGVASTKAFTCQLAVLASLAVAAGRARGVLSAEDECTLVQALVEVPRLMSETLAIEPEIESLARYLAGKPSVMYLGRGVNYPLSLEGALKLKEISYIRADAYAAGELKHGPIALIDEHMPVIVTAPYNELFEKTCSNMQEVAARGGRIILITDKRGADETAASGMKPMHTLVVPTAPEFVTPFVCAVPLQLIAYHTAVVMGTDVDQPRNLAKSVTVE